LPSIIVPAKMTVRGVWAVTVASEKRQQTAQQVTREVTRLRRLERMIMQYTRSRDRRKRVGTAGGVGYI
jgi:hypothetical protein